MAELRRSLRDRPPEVTIGQTPLASERTAASAATAIPPADLIGRAHDGAPRNSLPPWNIVEAYTRFYLKHCNYQPLPLFSEDLVPTLPSRDPELLLAIVSLASRFGTIGPPIDETSWLAQVKEYAAQAKELVMRRVSYGPVELSTIQSLCLLSLADFHSGNTPQASTYSALALDLAQSAGLSSEDRRTKSDAVLEERRKCYWSVVLLKNLYGSQSTTICFSRDEKTPNFPHSPQAPASTSSQMTDAALEQPETTNNSQGPSDLGIVAYVLEMSKIWQKAARYAHRRGEVGSLPPWSSQSDYSQITAELMDSETTFPYKYRFRPARFTEQHSARLQEHREFWASWVFLQLLYHTILCLLNHPLLLSLRLRSHRVTMIPEVFLQHTADLTATHTEWIVHLLDVCDKMDFKLYNPFIAHSAAIAATVYLQQSYSGDSAVRSTKQECFRKCASCIRRLGCYWPAIEQLATKVERFEQVVSNSYHESASQVLDSRVFIDLNLFWEIIEASSVAELPQTANPYFGSSLTSYRQPLPSEEVLRTRLLPEPTRITSGGDGVTPESGVTSTIRLPDFLPEPQYVAAGLLPPTDGNTSILAQNYFALGEDLVGNLDDWWNPQHVP